MVKDFAGNKDYIQKLNAIEKSREAYVKGHNTPPGVPTQKGLTGDVEFIAEAYPVVEFGNYDIPEGWENALAKPMQTDVYQTIYNSKGEIIDQGAPSATRVEWFVFGKNNKKGIIQTLK